MLSEAEATQIVKKAIPKGRIEAVVSYRDLYLFQVFEDDDPEEGDQDPFYSVNKNTKEFRDFSIFRDGNMPEIANLFREKKRKPS